ncbi:unnamed protein product [Anisakis simplex]|uniref:VEFS-Box domain-containing protein n=1 Tax=Anisakis simplex TaxID=6269 RepID=A0A158PP73_ANISI|nr:unnamed protein product [Anisakis simplex]
MMYPRTYKACERAIMLSREEKFTDNAAVTTCPGGDSNDFEAFRSSTRNQSFARKRFSSSRSRYPPSSNSTYRTRGRDGSLVVLKKARYSPEIPIRKRKRRAAATNSPNSQQFITDEEHHQKDLDESSDEDSLALTRRRMAFTDESILNQTAGESSAEDSNEEMESEKSEDLSNEPQKYEETDYERQFKRAIRLYRYMALPDGSNYQRPVYRPFLKRNLSYMRRSAISSTLQSVVNGNGGDATSRSTSEDGRGENVVFRKKASSSSHHRSVDGGGASSSIRSRLKTTATASHLRSIEQKRANIKSVLSSLHKKVVVDSRNVATSSYGSSSASPSKKEDCHKNEMVMMKRCSSSSNAVAASTASSPVKGDQLNTTPPIKAASSTSMKQQQTCSDPTTIAHDTFDFEKQFNNSSKHANCSHSNTSLLRFVDVRNNDLPGTRHAMITVYLCSEVDGKFDEIIRVPSATVQMPVNNRSTPVNIDLPHGLGCPLDFTGKERNDYVIIRVTFSDEEDARVFGGRTLRGVPSRQASKAEVKTTRRSSAAAESAQSKKRNSGSEESTSAVYGARCICSLGNTKHSSGIIYGDGSINLVPEAMLGITENWRRDGSLAKKIVDLGKKVHESPFVHMSIMQDCGAETSSSEEDDDDDDEEDDETKTYSSDDESTSCITANATTSKQIALDKSKSRSYLQKLRRFGNGSVGAGGGHLSSSDNNSTTSNNHNHAHNNNDSSYRDLFTPHPSVKNALSAAANGGQDTTFDDYMRARSKHEMSLQFPKQICYRFVMMYNDQPNTTFPENKLRFVPDDPPYLNAFVNNSSEDNSCSNATVADNINSNSNSSNSNNSSMQTDKTYSSSKNIISSDRQLCRRANASAAATTTQPVQLASFVLPLKEVSSSDYLNRHEREKSINAAKSSVKATVTSNPVVLLTPLTPPLNLSSPTGKTLNSIHSSPDSHTVKTRRNTPTAWGSSPLQRCTSNSNIHYNSSNDNNNLHQTTAATKLPVNIHTKSTVTSSAANRTAYSGQQSKHNQSYPHNYNHNHQTVLLNAVDHLHQQPSTNLSHVGEKVKLDIPRRDSPLPDVIDAYAEHFERCSTVSGAAAGVGYERVTGTCNDSDMIIANTTTTTTSSTPNNDNTQSAANSVTTTMQRQEKQQLRDGGFSERISSDGQGVITRLLSPSNKCLFCLGTFPDMFALLMHLRTSYPRLDIVYRGDIRLSAAANSSAPVYIDVFLREHFDGSFEGNLLRQYVGCCRNRIIPQRCQPTDRLTYIVYKTEARFIRHMPKDLSIFFTQSDREKRALRGNNAAYFGFRSRHPLMSSSQVQAKQLDQEWMRQMINRQIEDFVDLSRPEKEFMKLWNLFILNPNNRPFGWCHMYRTCRLFLDEHRDELLKKGLRGAWMYHLAAFNETDALDTEETYDLTQRLNADYDPTRDKCHIVSRRTAARAATVCDGADPSPSVSSSCSSMPSTNQQLLAAAAMKRKPPAWQRAPIPGPKSSILRSASATSRLSSAGGQSSDNEEIFKKFHDETSMGRDERRCSSCSTDDVTNRYNPVVRRNREGDLAKFVQKTMRIGPDQSMLAASSKWLLASEEDILTS